MSTERFMEAMAAEADRQCTDILDSAQDRAARLVADAHAAFAERREKAINVLKKKNDLLETQTRERAQAEAARKVFSMRSALVQESVKAAAANFKQMANTSEFAPVLFKLLDESLRMADRAVPVTAHVPGKFEDAVKSYLEHNDCTDIQVVSQGAPPDGVIITAADGSFTIRNSLSLRLNQLETKACALAYKHFFSEPDFTS